MDYEGVSAIVVLAVLILFIAGWLPTRTADSMKRVIRRRQDKYSPSLHLIDEHSGTRFSDGHSPVTKGAVMRPAQAKGARVSHEHIAEVRRLRRASIRRRRIIACVLLLACVVVGVLSYLLHFSPLYVLIPAGFLVLTIALGARASRHARAWETKVSKLLAQERRERTRSGKPRTAAAEHVAAAKAVDGVSGSASEGIEAAEHSAPAPADQAPVDQTPEAQADAVETSLMEQQEIHRAVEQGMAERDRRLARRAFRQSVDAETGPETGSHDRKDAAGQGGQQHADAGAVRDIQGARGANGRDDADAAAQAATDDTNARNTQSAAPAEPATAEHGESAGSVEPGARNGQAEKSEPADQTLELSQVSPASSLDVFDMAAGRHQDLISFSWGAPRNIEEHAEQDAPESLEIKSTRQVAKAVPVKEHAHERTQGKHGDTPVNNAETFHHAESNAHVDVPEETTDSLGHDLRAVLQRRSS